VLRAGSSVQIARRRQVVTPVAALSRVVPPGRGVGLCLVTALALAACGGGSHEAHTRTAAGRPVEHGLGTYYGREAQGGPTASGERFDRRKLTAAHRTLPLGTWVRVTNTRNGRSVEVRINDRGPYGRGRIIDVSEAAARQLGMLDAGVVPVTVEVLR
jgi:rare lipoprotein A